MASQMLGVALRTSRGTTQVMLEVSLRATGGTRARWDKSLVVIIQANECFTYPVYKYFDIICHKYYLSVYLSQSYGLDHA